MAQKGRVVNKSMGKNNRYCNVYVSCKGKKGGRGLHNDHNGHSRH